MLRSVPDHPQGNLGKRGECPEQLALLSAIRCVRGGAVGWSYKPECSEFDSRWGSVIFFIALILPDRHKWVPGVSPGGKGGRWVGLTTLPPTCADCLEIVVYCNCHFENCVTYTVNHEAVRNKWNIWQSTVAQQDVNVLSTTHAFPLLSTKQHDINSTSYEFGLMHFP